MKSLLTRKFEGDKEVEYTQEAIDVQSDLNAGIFAAQTTQNLLEITKEFADDMAGRYW